MITTISIITVNYNGKDDTIEMIRSLPAVVDGLHLEVIVVDNGSKAGEADELQRLLPEGVKLIRSEQNLGFAGGNNLGIREATGDYLFFVNNDVLFGDFSFEPMLRLFASNKQIGGINPKIRFAWGDNNIQFCGYTEMNRITVRNRAIGYNEPDLGQYTGPRPTPYMHGAAMMVSREVLQKAGEMPECYFLYYEELDWSLRIREQGYQLWVCPECEIFHKESASTGQGSPLRNGYIKRNRRLFVRRNYRQPWRLLALTYLSLLSLITNR